MIAQAELWRESVWAPVPREDAAEIARQWAASDGGHL